MKEAAQESGASVWRERQCTCGRREALQHLKLIDEPQATRRRDVPAKVPAFPRKLYRLEDGYKLCEVTGSEESAAQDRTKRASAR